MRSKVAKKILAETPDEVRTFVRQSTDAMVRIDPSLNKYDDIVLFPDKLAKANEQLKKSGFPKLPKKKHNR